MPELPDITLYVRALTDRIQGHALSTYRLRSPFVLRTVEPAVEDFIGRTVTGVERLGKKIVLAFDSDTLFFVFHLMIAGRFQWRDAGYKAGSRIDLAAFEFSDSGGMLVLTEAGTKKRAALYCVSGRDALLSTHSPGGVEPLECELSEFAEALRLKNQTLKRALTSPRCISGVGNSYSDEILHAARLSPFKRTGQLSDAEIETLYRAMREILGSWTQRLLNEYEEAGRRFPGPGSVTAFRKEFAAHGRYGQPCPVCGSPVQHVVYAEKNEMNYCATCQTGGKVLADRSLSRLLKDEWPRTIEEWEG
ncbi:MAG: formamidopyrimidine-DNA glycosylase [Planctomycetes bacterium]|nr:formamidopyrimidine-DNA glycosylase [Planctomycetota bacterium]NOG53817.1 formamidopyrimidine-DNA glycosylase [Planctomycetota bacterium]